jgi:exopolyphosphatase/guanosine-5'-triphosphate,3'-diphosphate pyrophosphatase
LVVDIGGGSTECILGTGYSPQEMESLYMGCISYSMRFFSDGKLSKSNIERAEIAARTELHSVRWQFSSPHWQEAVGSSGTARTLGEIMRLNGSSDGAITRQGLAKLHGLLLKAGEVKKLQLPGLPEERVPVFAGGFAIMSAAFSEFGIDNMTVASTALREGVLYELLGRMHHHDTREVTVRQFMRRYHVDSAQARRVQSLALALLQQVLPKLQIDPEAAGCYLTWAAKLHEIGITIAHPGYHKHSAYIIENADMPGFSRKEQLMLGQLLRTQRRSLAKVGLPLQPADDRTTLFLVLRLAVLFNRNRTDDRQPTLDLGWNREGFQLKIEPRWLENNPLTEAELAVEISYWKEVGVSLSSE